VSSFEMKKFNAIDNVVVIAGLFSGRLPEMEGHSVLSLCVNSG